MEKGAFATAILFLLGSTLGCFEHDWLSSFGKEGFSSCPVQNYLITGFKRGTGNKLSNLEKIECCHSDTPIFAEQVPMCLVADWTVTSNR